MRFHVLIFIIMTFSLTGCTSSKETDTTNKSTTQIVNTQESVEYPIISDTDDSSSSDFTHIDDEYQNSTNEISGNNLPLWKKAYIDYFNQPDNLDFNYYCIEDINSDGVPEIFVDRQVLYGIDVFYVDKSNYVDTINCVSSYSIDDGCILTLTGYGTFTEAIYKYNPESGMYNRTHEGTYSMGTPDTRESYSVDGVSYESLDDYFSAFNSLYESDKLEKISCTDKVDTLLSTISDYQ